MNELAPYDYTLPPELIAKEPLPRRDGSRLLVVERKTGRLEHRTILDLPEFLRPGDCLVMNDTRVVPARIFGYRESTGGKWEGLFLDQQPTGEWRLIGQSGGKLKPREVIVLTPAHDPSAADRYRLILQCCIDGTWTALPSPPSNQFGGSAFEVLQRFGTVPLPPYIQRKLGSDSDRERYQTIYASRPGAAAAPTAGLHLTTELLAACRSKGVKTPHVTLHVGIGTFRPITAQRLEDHAMHGEWCELPEDSCRVINAAHREGGRIVAVGTTTVRTLETAARDGRLAPWSGETSLFIRPPYEFRAVDCLLTNFHLPRSSLLVLVSAFAGLETIRNVYAEAIRQRYRFYSYGDAMLIV